ncbi:putative U3 small nucleolar RNA-associated protein 11 [Arctopsyche grandis]|uniref:putative U3 small nucleolar RNA-associated protein 11 n=1 Tax=Arctopsyche grandis TaxID=121162 RepID=UPI00406DA1F9
MSSWKNAAKCNQKRHRERRQPSAREHLGALEKKQDYRLRAKDFSTKRKALALLAKRAMEKNPDEFYHHMINSKVKCGEHHEVEKEDEHTPEQVKLMQTQDLKYINMKRTIESNKIKRLQSQLHLIDTADSVSNSHTFFVDDEKEMKNFDVVERLQTHPALLKHRTNRLKITDLENIKMPKVNEKNVEMLKEKRNKSYKELAKRIDREKELTVVQQKMELKRCLIDKKCEKPMRIKAATKNSAPIYKWKYERKK